MQDDQGRTEPPTLNGWKEIAAHLGKSVRSVQRWEATLGLPVRRIRTPDGQIVYAERAEIDAWRRRLDTTPTPEPEDPLDPDSLVDPPSEPAPPLVEETVEVPGPGRPYWTRVWLPLGAMALFAGGLLTGWALTRSSPVAVGVVVAGRSLQAVNAQGLMVWSYPFDHDVSEPGNGVPKPVLADLDGDQSLEWIVPVRGMGPGAPPATSDSLYVFTQDGTLKWSVTPDQNLTYPNRTMRAPWMMTDFALSPASPRRLWVAFAHHTGSSSFVLELDPLGTSRIRYVQFGRIHTVAHWTTPAGGFLGIAGSSSEHRRATLVLMPEIGQAASYPIDDRSRATCAECPTALPHRMFLFPPSELTTAAHEQHPYVVHLSVIGSALQVMTYQGQGHGLFVIDPGFSVASWQLTDTYWGAHRQLEQQGRLDHSADRCPDRSSPKLVREWTPAGGWKEFEIPAGPERPSAVPRDPSAAVAQAAS